MVFAWIMPYLCIVLGEIPGVCILGDMCGIRILEGDMLGVVLKEKRS